MTEPPATELAGFTPDGRLVASFVWSFRHGLWEGRCNGLLVCVPRREQAEACLRRLGAADIKLSAGGRE